MGIVLKRRDNALLQVKGHENKVLSELDLIAKRYLGNKGEIDNIYQLLINWRQIRKDILDLHLQKNNDVGLKYAEEKSNQQVAELQSKIVTICSGLMA